MMDAITRPGSLSEDQTARFAAVAVGVDIHKEIDLMSHLTNEEGLTAYLDLVSIFSSFEPATAVKLLTSGHSIFGAVTAAARAETLSLLFGLSRVKWSAASAALAVLPDMAAVIGGDHQGIIPWLKRGISLASIDQDVAIAYFKTSLEVHKQLGLERLDAWAALGEEIARLSWKAAREYFVASPEVVSRIDRADIERWARIGLHLIEKSPKLKPAHDPHSLHAIGSGAGKGRTIDLAVRYFKSSPKTLARLSVKNLEEWVQQGLQDIDKVANAAEGKKGEAFFEMQTGASRRSMEQLIKGLELKKVHAMLSSYAAALFDRIVPIRTSAMFYRDLPGLGKFFAVTDGTRIFLPSKISLFEDDSLNSKAYKWFLTHELGHIEYGTFSLTDQDHALLQQHKAASTAMKIFTFLEDERVDYLTGLAYPGLERDRLALIAAYRKTLASSGESLTLCEEISFSSGDCPAAGGSFLGQLLAEGRSRVRAAGVFASDVVRLAAGIADRLSAEDWSGDSSGGDDRYAVFYRGALDFLLVNEARTATRALAKRLVERLAEIDRTVTEDLIEAAFIRIEEAKGLETEDLVYRQYGRKYAGKSSEEDFESLFEEVQTTLDEMEEESRFRRAVFYDEWDFRMDDYKKEWCRVREMDMPEGTLASYNQTITENHGLVNALKRHFGLLRPDRFKRIFREERGDDLDFDALIETLVDRHAGVPPSDRVYIRRDKRQRDVSVAFLADMSFSTSDVLPSGKRIIDVEREGLILMAEALESIGDQWAVYGFSSEYREKVDFLVVKDFKEVFGDPVKQRFEGIRPIMMTRLGAAIRHANSLLAKQDSAIRLLILLSDGRPYDVDYGDSDYAMEDTRSALWEGRRLGINSFCVTVDKKSQDYLPYMYGESHYTVINNVDALPVMLPLIYKRLTT
ncbi:MAG: hypothetical protein C0402_09200 [Thermodesulfovibrio sp.]|nr:hypothetical protein [Thermodesulfovibrio sp.]